MLLETIIAMLVFGVMGAAVLSGLSTAHRAGAKIEQQPMAEVIARNQMEYVLSLPYVEPPSPLSRSKPSGACRSVLQHRDLPGW